MSASTRGPGERISIYPVLAVNFIGTLGYSLILPFLIFLVTRLEGNALVYGLLGATYPAFQLFGAPVLGRWSDVYGRRRVLLLSQVGTLLSWLVFGLALLLPVEVLFESAGGLVLTLPIVVLFAARALDGLTGGNVSVANAYLADITDDADRSANFGKMAISSNLGYIVGPALAGLLGATRLEELLPVLAAIGISVVGTVLVARLREPDPCATDPGPPRMGMQKVLGLEPRDCVRVEDPEPVRFRDVFQLDGVAYMLALYFLIFLGFNFFYTAFPVHAAQTLGWSIPETGTFFGALSLMMVTVQGPVLKALSKRVSEAALIVAGNLVLVGCFLLLTSHDKGMIYLAAALMALGNGVMWPSVLALLSKLAGETHQGSVQGFAGSAGSLASIIGLIAGGVLYGAVGAGTFLVSAATLLLVTVLSLKLLRATRPELRG